VSPRIASSAPHTLVPLDGASGAALHRQIYDALRDAVLAGRLAPGARVPATRVLAAELGVSRNTASAALAQLVAEGYVEARERSGTFVTATLPDAALELTRARRARSIAPARPALSRQGARLAASRLVATGRAEAPRAFRTGLPALDEFPWALWSRLTSRRLRTGMNVLADYGSPAGYAPLRAAIAEHVAAARGTSCDPAQVIVTGGAQQGLDLVARLLVDVGDAVWMEDPGYPGARAAFGAAGARVVPVPMDGEGLDVDAGVRRAPSARLAYVTPSHQYPTGVTMTAARRLRLLRWARDAGAWIVEDDYDGAYRYASRPLASLHGLDDGERVVYVGSFSKTLFPALRLGWLVVPPALVDAFAAARAVADRQSPSVDQAVLAQFIDDGHFARHVRRMRVLYQERRDALLDAAPALLGDRLVLAAGDAGMHVVGALPAGVDDRALSARARELGVEAPALTSYAAAPMARGGLLLGYAAFPPRVLRASLRKLAGALG
jgi:GntR family transcriptional regulator/MocR family aminotransferase